jgi:hypothetical protein
MTQAVLPTEEGAAARRKEAPSIESLAPYFPQLEIVEVLGRGGMGVVYKARQRSLNRWVALKLLAPERAGEPEFSARFEREALALASLNHPNIVAVYDFGESGGFFYLLMEYVDGANLRQLLSAKQFTPEEALSIVPPICEALQCAHDRGIVHRDIKPENLLIDRTGVVKIADFGIAKLVGTGISDASGAGSETSPHAVDGKTHWAGTVGYAAPEQRQSGVPQDHRADIYSLGVVLYELLTGERPGALPLEAPLRKIRVDFRVDEIVLRALEKEPELRFPTATEFRERVLEVGASVGAAGGSAVPEKRNRGVGRFALMSAGAILLLWVSWAIFGLPPTRRPAQAKKPMELPQSALFPGMPEPFPFEGSLGIGSPAPALEPEVWIHGSPVETWEPGRVYVVLFWSGEGSALGNRAVEEGLKPLENLAHEFASSGLVTVAHYTGQHQSLQKARAALDSLGASVPFGVSASPKDYVIPFDRWIQAAGFWDRSKGSGIISGPVAFVINGEGRLAWMGALKQLPKALLESVLKGSFDLAQATLQFTNLQRKSKRGRDLEQDFLRSLSLGLWHEASWNWKEGASLHGSWAWMPGEFWIALARRDLDAAAEILQAAEQSEGDWTSKLGREVPLPLRMAWELVGWGELTPKATDAVQKVADTILQKRPKDSNARMLLARVAIFRNQVAQAVAHQKAAMEDVDAKGASREKMEEDLEELSRGRAPKGYSYLRDRLEKFSDPTRPKSLELGKPAPPMLGGQWTRGEAVEGWKRGTSYLVYVWNSEEAKTVGRDFREIREFWEQLKKDGLTDDLVIVVANIREKRRAKAEELLQPLASLENLRVFFDNHDVLRGLWGVNQGDRPAYYWVNKEGAWSGFSVSYEGALAAHSGKSAEFSVSASVRRMLLESAFEGEVERLNRAFAVKDWDSVERVLSRWASAGEHEKLRLGASFHLAVGRGDLEKARLHAENILGSGSAAPLLQACVGALRTLPDPLPPSLREVAHALAVKAKRECLHAECRSLHLNSLAWTTFQRGERSEALKLAEQALAESPKDPEYVKLFGEDLEAYRQGRLPAPLQYSAFAVHLQMEQVK